MDRKWLGNGWANILAKRRRMHKKPGSIDLNVTGTAVKEWESSRRSYQCSVVEVVLPKHSFWKLKFM